MSRALTLALLAILAAACGVSVEAELGRLADPDPAVRRDAALALGTVGDLPEVREALLTALEDDSDLVRDAAAASLVRIDPGQLRTAADRAGDALGVSFAEVLPDAVEAAFEADDIHMLAALPRAMLLLAPHGESVLRDLLSHDRAIVRSWAADGLSARKELTDETVASLAKCLDDEDEIVRISALHGLCRAGPRAASSLDRILELFADPDREMLRSAAADAIAAIGPGAAKASPALVAALADESYDVSSGAADALAAIGGAAVGDLIPALESPDQGVREHAVIALAEIGPAAAPAAQALTQRVVDSSADAPFRGKCALALGRIGPEAAGAVEALVGLLSTSGGDPDDVAWARTRAAEAIGRIGPDAGTAAPALLAAIESEGSEGLVLAAAEAHFAVTGEYIEAAGVLMKLVDETESAHICEQAAEAIPTLGRQGGDLVVLGLVSAVTEGDRPAPLAIGKALRGILRESNGDLETFLASEQPTVRIPVALALSGVHAPAMELLVNELGSEAAAERELVARALGKIGPAAMESVPALLDRLVDDNEDVRMAAAESIAAIDPERAARSRDIDRIRFGGTITEKELRRIARTIREMR